MIKLREYQERAIENCLNSLKQGNNPLIVLPTGSGKSLALAAIAKELSKKAKVLVATHRKELIEQDSGALATLCGDDLYSIYSENDDHYSIYSASCNEKDLSGNVVFAQIQSLHRAENIPDFGYIIIDEAHLINPKAQSMYQKLFEKLPSAQRIGLTATPYRLDSGLLVNEKSSDFDNICIHITAKELMPEYLAPLIGVTNEEQIDTTGIHTRMGDFVTRELEQVVCNDDVVGTTCSEMLRHVKSQNLFEKDRNHVLVFATSVSHAQMIVEYLEMKGEKAAMVTGKTDMELRAKILEDFRNSKIRFLVNVAVLTTGVDLPMVDCLVHMRPTKSKSLYVQIQGRAMRKHPGKENAKILDFAGNMIRHGDLDSLDEHVNLPEEKRKREDAERKKKRKSRKLKIGEVDDFSDPLNAPELMEFDVHNIRYVRVNAKKHAGLTNVIAEYDCGKIKVRKWLCPEYSSGASWFAHQWLKNRGYSGHKITDANKFIRAASSCEQPMSITAFRDRQGYWQIKVEHYL